MKKVAIVFWSGTGNTEAMAELIAHGVCTTGAITGMFQASDFTPDHIDVFDAFAFGCPAMGDEELEDAEFLPMYDRIEPLLANRKVALFGSCQWGGGEWMQCWKQRAADAGITVIATVISKGYPDDDVAEECTRLGRELAE